VLIGGAGFAFVSFAPVPFDVDVESFSKLLNFRSYLLVMHIRGAEGVQFVVQSDELIHQIVFYFALVVQCHIDKPPVRNDQFDLTVFFACFLLARGADFRSRVAGSLAASWAAKRALNLLRASSLASNVNFLLCLKMRGQLTGSVRDRSCCSGTGNTRRN
jgi:hypothetical protein